MAWAQRPTDNKLCPVETLGDGVIACEREHRQDPPGVSLVRHLELEDGLVCRASSDEVRKMVQLAFAVPKVARRALVERGHASGPGLLRQRASCEREEVFASLRRQLYPCTRRGTIRSSS